MVHSSPLSQLSHNRIYSLNKIYYLLFLLLYYFFSVVFISFSHPFDIKNLRILFLLQNSLPFQIPIWIFIFTNFKELMSSSIDPQQQQQQQHQKHMQHHQQQQMHHHHQQMHQSDIERMDPGTKSEGEEDSQQGTIKAKATLGRTPNHLTLRYIWVF